MIWEANVVEQHGELIESEFKSAIALFKEKDKNARLIEYDEERYVIPTLRVAINLPIYHAVLSYRLICFD